MGAAAAAAVEEELLVLQIFRFCCKIFRGLRKLTKYFQIFGSVMLREHCYG